MTAGVCREFYDNKITSFILASSDSDYWGLISSLPNADFLVMYEYNKCGSAIKQALDTRGIYYCSIDDFCSGNIEVFKNSVLLDLLKSRINEIPDITVETSLTKYISRQGLKPEIRKKISFLKDI